MSLTKLIAKTLKDRKLTVASAAKASGINYQSFASVSKGDAKPNARTAPRYAAFLGISVDELDALSGGKKTAAPKKAAAKTVKKAAPKKAAKKPAAKTVKKAAPKKAAPAAPNKALLRSLNAALKDVEAIKTKIQNAIKAAS